MEAIKEAASNMAMDGEKSKMREILDMFEGAGFTVTYFYHRESMNYFQISIRSNGIKDSVPDYREGPEIVGDIITLIKKYHYRLTYFKTGPGVVSDYAGTVYFAMIPAGTATREESPWEKALQY
jgi:hypothetical protein